MKKLVLAAIGILSLASSAPAALILHVGDAVVDSSATSATVDVWLEETEGTDATIAAYAVGVRLAPTASGIQVSGFGASTPEHPSLFNTVPFDFTTNVSGYNADYDRFLTFDSSTNVAVENDAREGLFSLTYSIAPGTTGAFTLVTDPTVTEIADPTGTPIPVLIDNGSIVITPIPEPAAMGLALLALPLLARRRR